MVDFVKSLNWKILAVVALVGAGLGALLVWLMSPIKWVKGIAALAIAGLLFPVLYAGIQRLLAKAQIAAAVAAVNTGAALPA